MTTRASFAKICAVQEREECGSETLHQSVPTTIETEQHAGDERQVQIKRTLYKEGVLLRS